MVLLSVAFMLAGSLPVLVSTQALNFEKNKTISGDDVEETNPDIAVTGSGDTAKVYIVFEYREQANSLHHIYFRKSVDGGISFPTTADYEEDFNPSPGDGDKQGKPSIAVRGNDICIVYQDNQWRTNPSFTAENMIVAQVSHNAGLTWTQTVLTPETENLHPSSTMTDPFVAFDQDGNLFVVFANKGKIWIAYSLDSGDTWEYPTQVKDPSAPSNPTFVQKSPTVASNGNYAVVAFQSDPDYVQASYFTRATVPTIGGSMNFDDLKLFSHPVLQGSTPDGYNPRLTGTSAFHGIYWDFSVEPSGFRNNEDLLSDRPGESYTRSSDNGASFSIAGKARIVVNNSQTNAWHSTPDISVGTGGHIGVAWYDYTLGMKQPSVFVSVSTDGTTWSKPDRVTNFHPDDYICDIKTGPRIAVDDTGNCHVVWVLRDTSSSYGDVQYTRSSPNVPPAGVTGVDVYLDADEPWSTALATWNINNEPDFKEYQVHLGTEADFVPGPATLQRTDTRQANNTFDLFGLKANTQYYLKVAVLDTAGLTGYSEEKGFKTYPMNEPPKAPKFLEVDMLEDTAAYMAINLTNLVETGVITDDHYNGHYDLYYEIEPWFGYDNITALVRPYGDLNHTYMVVDFFTQKPDFVPIYVQFFNLKISDTGRDGAPDNPDDMSTITVINVTMNSVNDFPKWDEFTDLSSNAKTPILPFASVLDLTSATVGAIEDQPYRFALKGSDVDGDFLYFSCTDPRVLASPDDNEFKFKWNFEFTPTNDDVPFVNLNVTMDDKNGGSRNITVILPVTPVNDRPVILTINDKPFKIGTYDFEMDEETTLSFNVTAFDQDPDDVLKLSSVDEKYPDRVTFVKENASIPAWTVNVVSLNDDPQGDPPTIDFKLLLEDKLHAYVEVPVTILVKNRPDPPAFRKGASGFMGYDYFFVHDEKDIYEWGGATKPGGDVIRAEWGETVRFVGLASDSDNEELNYTWKVTNTLDVDKSKVKTYYGRQVDIEFYPFNGILYKAPEEDFGIDLIVTDNVFDPISKSFPMRVFGDDGDNDNDGLPDVREEWFFNQLVKSDEVTEFDPKEAVDKETFVYEAWVSKYRTNLHYEYFDLLTAEVRADFLKLLNTTGDPDREGESNYNEIGFGIPLYDTEKRSPYSLNMDFLDPFNPGAYPGTKWTPQQPPFIQEGAGIPAWAFMLGGGILFIVIILVGGIIVILRWNKRKEEQEDAEIERRVQEAERRAKEINTLYGSKYKAGEVIGPDQSTLDDLKLDLGGAVYHEEGSGGIVDASGHKQKDKTGPGWQSTAGGGPAFEKTAVKLEFGEKLELETIGHEADTGEMDHSNLDEEELEGSFEEILDAADEYNADMMGKAGGNVQIGALTMDQLREQKAQTGHGPRLPPPGQEPPRPMPVPPGQAPPGMPPAPRVPPKKIE